MIDYRKIFKQAASIMRAHKFLWAFGLFLIWNTIFNFLSYILNTQTVEIDDRLAALILIGVLLLTYLYFRAKAAVVIAVKSILTNKPTGFLQAFKESKLYYKKLFLLSAVIVLGIVAATLILSIPVIDLWQDNMQSRAIILGIVALLILAPILLVAHFSLNLASIIVIFYDKKIKSSLQISYDLISKFWPWLILFSFNLGILTLFNSYFLLWLWTGRIAFLSSLSYNLLGIVAGTAFLIFGSLLVCFQEVSWIVLFNELNKPTKIEEEAVPVPETI